jgi:ERCC4-type nuclease
VTQPFIILCDTREQRPPPFPEGVVLERCTLGEADYTGVRCQGVGVIERKSASDFVSSLSHGRERFDDEIRRLQPYRWKLVVVEADLSQIYRVSAMHPHSILGSIASLTARWDTPVLFAANEAGCGRLIAGVIRRWEARILSESSASVGHVAGSRK